jgi:undecaprenyl-diphosphatase
MSTPIIFGAGVVKIPKLLRAMQAAGGATNEGGAHVTAVALLAAVVASAIVGVVVIRWILQFLRTRGYGAFAVYRWVVAALVVAVWFSRKG